MPGDTQGGAGNLPPPPRGGGAKAAAQPPSVALSMTKRYFTSLFSMRS
jgi:hypothetical protein